MEPDQNQRDVFQSTHMANHSQPDLLQTSKLCAYEVLPVAIHYNNTRPHNAFTLLHNIFNLAKQCKHLELPFSMADHICNKASVSMTCLVSTVYY